MKCNLRRHINSNHMDKTFNCTYCDKCFKRNDYLKRHIFKRHHNKDVFSRISDCISTECSPEIQKDFDCSTAKSSGCNSVDEFLDTIISEELPSPSYSEATTTDFCTSNPPTVDANPLYSDVAIADAFLESLADMDSPPLPRSPTSAREVQDSPIAVTADLVITQRSPHQSLNSLVTQGSQTEIYALPPTRQWIHKGTDTTPKFTRDKTHQVAVSTTEANTSPHVLQVDYNPMQGWHSPLVSSPQTPDVNIPCSFTSAYQARRRELNLPEGVTYQGPMSNCDDENPLLPHLHNSPIAWGNTPKPCESLRFQLLDYLEDMCTHITPPI